MYNYTDRFDAVKKAWSHGFKEARNLKLGENWKNWSPLNIYVYSVGVIAGVFSGLASVGIGYIFTRILIK